MYRYRRIIQTVLAIKSVILLKDKILKWEKDVAKKHLEFEIMCKDKNDAAAKALLEAENWTRKRLRLSRPVVMLERNITCLR